MIKHILKIFRSEHLKILKVYLAIFQHYAWKGNEITIVRNSKSFSKWDISRGNGMTRFRHLLDQSQQ